MNNIHDEFSDLDLSQIFVNLSKGDLPVKYNYILSGGADGWSGIEESGYLEKGASYNDSILLIKNKNIYLQELNTKDDIVIFDFGCGIGKTVESFLRDLSSDIRVYYHAFDISRSMIQRNKKKIYQLSENIIYSADIVDFEKGDFFEKMFTAKLKYKNKNILGLFLGNTLGNFVSEERILSNIMDIFSTEDRLIVGIGRPEIQNELWINLITEHYNSPNILNFVSTTVRYLLKDIDAKYYSYFDKLTATVNVVCEFNKDSKIFIKGKEISFEKGQKIRIAKSKKINEKEFSQISENLNLRICNLRTNSENNYLQICLANKRFF